MVRGIKKVKVQTHQRVNKNTVVVNIEPFFC